MNYVSKYNNNKATVCAGKACVTVYGRTAEFVNTLVVFAIAIFAIFYVAKLLR